MTRFFTWLVVSLSSAAALAADPWLGKQVFWKPEAKPELKVDGAAVSVFIQGGATELAIENVPFPAMVTTVYGDWLLVENGGWLRNTDVMEADEALAFYTERIRQQPEGALLWRHRGIIWRARGEPEKAIGDYTAAIRLNPNDVASYVDRAQCWSQKGEDNRAIRDATEAIRLDPAKVSAYSDRAGFFERIGDYGKAIQDYTECIRLQTWKSNHYMKTASCWYDINACDKALQDYAAMTQLHYPGAVANAYGMMAQIQATCYDDRVRDGAKAIQNATKACQMTGWQDRQYVGALAAAYAETGDFENAIRWQEKAIELCTNELEKQYWQHSLQLFKSKQPLRVPAREPRQPAADGKMPVGMRVVAHPGSLDTPLKDGDKQIGVLAELPWPFVIEQVDGDLVRVGDTHRNLHGWVPRTAVASLDDAIKARSEGLRTNPNGQGYSDRSKLLLVKGDQDAAIRDLGEAIRLTNQPEFMQAAGPKIAPFAIYDLRATAHEQDGDKEAAEGDRRAAEAIRRKMGLEPDKRTPAQ